MSFRKILAMVVLFLFGSSAFLFGADNKRRDKNPFEIKVIGNAPLGAGAELGYNLGSTFYIGVKSTSAEYLFEDSSADADTADGSVEAEATLSFETQTAYLRISPFEASGFNLRLGAVSRDWTFSGTAIEEIGDSSQQFLYNVDITWPDSAIMYGLGWAWQTEGGFVWGVGYEAITGAEPDVEVTVSGTGSENVSQEDIEAEEDEWRDEVSQFKDVGSVYLELGFAF